MRFYVEAGDIQRKYFIHLLVALIAARALRNSGFLGVIVGAEA